jgi:hypothetical protein
MTSLVIAAHSGHELLLWKWLRKERPDFVVLTNGAGSSGVPRLDPTLANLAGAGANWVPQVVQPVADAEIYRALLEGDTRLFAQWLDALTSHVLARGIDCIVADEAEDYNPSHDLCRLLANQEPAIGANQQSLTDGLGIEFGYWSAGASAGVENHQRERAGLVGDIEQVLHRCGIGDIRCHGLRAGLGLQGTKLLNVAGGQNDAEPFLREEARQRGAQAGTRTGDDCDIGCHETSPSFHGTAVDGRRMSCGETCRIGAATATRNVARKRPGAKPARPKRRS